MNKLQTYLKVFLAVLLAFGAVSLYRSCRFEDSYRRLVKDYNVAKADYELSQAASKKTIKEQELVISGQSKKIADILANANKPTQAEKDKDKQIAALGDKIKKLEAQGDLAGALAAARQDIQAWSEKFDLAKTRYERDIESLDQAWKIKFNAQVIITDDYKVRLLTLESLNSKAEHRIGYLETTLRSSRLWGTVKTIAIAGIGGYFVYRELSREIPK